MRTFAGVQNIGKHCLRRCGPLVASHAVRTIIEYALSPFKSLQGLRDHWRNLTAIHSLLHLSYVHAWHGDQGPTHLPHTHEQFQARSETCQVPSQLRRSFAVSRGFGDCQEQQQQEL